MQVDLLGLAVLLRAGSVRGQARRHVLRVLAVRGGLPGLSYYLLGFLLLRVQRVSLTLG